MLPLHHPTEAEKLLLRIGVAVVVEGIKVESDPSIDALLLLLVAMLLA
jgi:hypothetical protein